MSYTIRMGDIYRESQHARFLVTGRKDPEADSMLVRLSLIDEPHSKGKKIATTGEPSFVDPEILIGNYALELATEDPDALIIYGPTGSLPVR